MHFSRRSFRTPTLQSWKLCQACWMSAQRTRPAYQPKSTFACSPSMLCSSGKKALPAAGNLLEGKTACHDVKIEQLSV